MTTPVVDVLYLPYIGSRYKQGVGDMTDNGGPVWHTWTNLRDATKAPWYGFGGAWGEVATVPLAQDNDVNVTGPLAPPCQNPLTTATDLVACPRR